MEDGRSVRESDRVANLQKNFLYFCSFKSAKQFSVRRTVGQGASGGSVRTGVM